MKSNIDSRLRQTISLLIRSSKKSRAQIADELSIILNCKVTVNILNGFTAKSKLGVRFPAAWVPALCEVLDDDRLMLLMDRRRTVPILEWSEDLKDIQGKLQMLLNKMQTSH